MCTHPGPVCNGGFRYSCCFSCWCRLQRYVSPTPQQPSSWNVDVSLWVSLTFSFFSSCLLAHFLPVTRTKPGYCPRVIKVIPLHKGCVCDDDCPGNHKCCSVERRDVCVPPAFSMYHWLEICHLKFSWNFKSCFAVVIVVWPHCKFLCCFRKARAVSSRSLGLGSVCRALLRWQRLSREGEVLLQWMWTPVHCTVQRFGKTADLYAKTL